MTTKVASKQGRLKANRTLNATPEQVRDTLFLSQAFFDAHDLLQVKYEMLRRVQTDGWSVTQAAATYGFSRTSFYQLQQAFSEHGLSGLLPQPKGPQGAHKLTHDVMAVIARWLIEQPRLSSQAMAQQLAEQLQLSVHPRSIERALQRQSKKKIDR